MKLSKQGAMELIGHEAIVQTRYRDTKNIWTIGVGHTKAAGDPDPAAYTEVMPLKEVFKLFQKDMQNYADDVNAALKVAVSQTEFRSISTPAASTKRAWLNPSTPETRRRRPSNS
jgi:lysozyme